MKAGGCCSLPLASADREVRLGLPHFGVAAT
jgi:hypothetical protein